MNPQELVTQGATLAAGGERLAHGADGFSMSPALFSESLPSTRINREETFGPEEFTTVKTAYTLA